jgi:hypothetical protein
MLDECATGQAKRSSSKSLPESVDRHQERKLVGVSAMSPSVGTRGENS